MKKTMYKTLTVLATAVAAISVGHWWFDPIQMINESSATVGNTKQSSWQASSPPTAPAAPAANPATAVDAVTALKTSVALIASGYQQVSQYPDYSVPLDQFQTDLLYPNAASSNRRDLTPAGLPLKISVEVSAYRHTFDQPIESLTSISGDSGVLAAIGSVRMSVRDSDNRILQTLKTRRSGDNGLFSALGQITSDSQQPAPAINREAATSSTQSWRSQFEGQRSWPSELNLTAEITLSDGQHFIQSTPFRLIELAAVITGVGRPWQDGNELVIPVQLEQAQKGYYKLGAVLYDADKRPIGYLQGKQQLKTSTGTIDLRAWGSLLHQLSQAQGLWLGSFQLRNVPARPGSPTLWGDSQQPDYALPTVNPEDFSNEPYQNQQAQARLEFLQALSGKAPAS
ncbi:hypothetical protein [Oceanobacter mangrovi]|uniref:hypothetical protein n=1 Tax=Oceanobacter mangrovi TaxID=2862510 RepID=UPI001C8EBEB6|nr:hypothetical protein [Oceanobacter mangrovi]